MAQTMAPAKRPPQFVYKLVNPTLKWLLHSLDADGEPNAEDVARAHPRGYVVVKAELR